MVHTMVPMSVKLKMNHFEPPARLINHAELCCAIGMACRQASLPCPEPENGMELKAFAEGLPAELFASPQVSPKLLSLIQNYIYKGKETVNEDSLVTLKLGYDGPA